MTDTSTITIETRVRYHECDPMGFAHHSVYPIWFELARTELLRLVGSAYADLEAGGLRIVVVSMEVRYRKPAQYDDMLRITARCTRSVGARIEHDYTIQRGDVLLCTGATTLACLDENGRVIPVPPSLRHEPQQQDR